MREATEALFRLLVESVRDYAIFMLDEHGCVATWNAGAERIKGYRADEIIGRHFSAFYPEEDVRAGKCEMELAAAARDGRFEDEGWLVRKDGTRFWANVVISAVRDRARIVGFSKVTRDLTDRKRAEEERTARLAAEAANRAKDEFLAILGHELRNPLAPIATAIQLMKLRGDDRTTKELHVIERQVDHMMRLVDDLLDISRIVEGKLELRRRSLDLRDVVAKALEIASPLIEQRGHHLEVHTPSGPVIVDGDDARLTQVFTNLLTNAAKYTDPGGHVALVVEASADDVTVVVQDDGIGIEPALLPCVFDLFVQGHQAIDRPHGGLGLGLALARTLVDLHGGRVEARSAGPGTGSTFVVVLPRGLELEAETAPTGKHFAMRQVGESRRVLIVDDNADALELLGDALTAAGHDVRTALDPPSALEVLGEFQPEVAIVDIGLPVMDGYELATRIRAALPTAKIQLIALTGYGQPDDLERSARAGFAAHFVKPVDIGRLNEAIAKT